MRYNGPLPNILLAGAPKCGTSSLYDWLCQHPSIEGSVPKEPFILMDEDNPLYNRKADFKKNGWSSYKPYFIRESSQYYLEASTHYIYQEGIIDKLLSLPKPPKIIFALRNPVDRLFSSFNYSINNLASIKAELSFEHYVDDLINNRPLNLDDNPSGYVLQRDLKYGDYFNYLSKWLKRYPNELIKVVLFDDMKQNPQVVLGQIFDFLELDYEQINFDLETKNETRTIKYRPLHRVLHSFNRMTSNFKIKSWIKNIYFKLQSGEKKSKASEKAINQLKKYYSEGIDKLEELTSLNLKSWK